MLLILVVMLIATACTSVASPVVENQSRPQVLSYEMDTANMPNSYNFHYNTSDGSSRTEEGNMISTGTDAPALDVLGAVRWFDEKGNQYEMTYKAGRRGYRTIIKKIS
ncbi:endocuticle structural protein SgAbd-6-like [Nymphalis io]|uniref:endocuticle structural protein SgAbd-6-like n=1 Tax=Inachis io TaxID=171585 RepID=UPI002169C574|nr:endocuticle structural protein SgAbd-6-like [Nymphalis io]